METARYVCHTCNRIEEFNMSRKTHPCPICSREMSYLSFNTVVGGILRNAWLPYGETKLIIPEGVEGLEGEAYKNKPTLCSIEFPSTLKEIPSLCFDGCTALKEIVIPGTVKKLGYGAFSNCSSIESIVLNDGTEEIGERAFYNCNNLKSVVFPLSLKEIGEEAFSNPNLRAGSSFKLIALPKSIKAIKTNAFGRINYDTIFLVSKESFAETYVKQHRYNYRTVHLDDGFACQDVIYAGTMYVPEKLKADIKIKPGVEKIAEGAFANHNEIKQVTFPNSLVEIQNCAFEGCRSIEKLNFNNGLETIGSRAFHDVKVKFLDLPGTVKNLASDAFPDSCIVSVAGEMPGYNKKLREILLKRGLIEIWRAKLNEVEKEIPYVESKLLIHELIPPKELEEIANCTDELANISSKIENKKSEIQNLTNSLESQLNLIDSELQKLSAEESKCSLFAVSRKRAIETQIADRKLEAKGIYAKIDQLNLEYSAMINQLWSEYEEKKSKLLLLKEKQEAYNKEGQLISKSLGELRNQKEELIDKMRQTANNDLEKEQKELEERHRLWNEEFEKAKTLNMKEQQISKLEAEKKKLISGLKLPKVVSHKTERNYAESSIDEKLINDAFDSFIENKSAKQYVIQRNKYIQDNAAKLERVKEINQLLEKPTGCGLENFDKIDEPEALTNLIPDRFLKLNKYFKKCESWSRLIKLSKGIAETKDKKMNIHEFFAGLEYLVFSNGNTNLLIFPYCAIICNADKQMKVYTYEKIRVEVSYIDKEEVTDIVPAYGELMSQRYTHVNLNGTPSRRYKNNPIIKTIRYTKVTFGSKKNKLLEFPVRQNGSANDFADACNEHFNELTLGATKGIYKRVCNGKDIAEIETEISRLAEKEKREQIRRRKEAEAEKKRIEKQRLAEEAAAEEKRREIIKRQQELNAERKRRAEEQKRRTMQIEKIFDDDFSGQSNITSTTSSYIKNITSAENPEFPFSITGKKSVSNTVFKVNVKILKNFVDDVVVYFTDENKVTISNKKRIAAALPNTDVTIGFVLNSGIDYAAMKKCYMSFEHQGDIIGAVEFKMNIAFSPDDF